MEFSELLKSKVFISGLADVIIGEIKHRNHPAMGPKGDGEERKVLYHGTSTEAVNSILRDGLIPGKSEGADAWAKKNGWGVIVGAAEGKQMSIYMTGNIKRAMYYADLAAKQRGWNPIANENPGVVLEIRIPKNSKVKLIQDKSDSMALRFEGKFPPEWIAEWNSYKSIKLKEIIYCVVFPINEKEQKSFYPLDTVEEQLIVPSLGLSRLLPPKKRILRKHGTHDQSTHGRRGGGGIELYHGTAEKNIEKILQEGLIFQYNWQRPNDHFVYASSSREDALIYARESLPYSEAEILGSSGGILVALVVVKPMKEMIVAGNVFKVENNILPKDILRVEIYHREDIPWSGTMENVKPIKIIKKEMTTREIYVIIPTEMLYDNAKIKSFIKSLVTQPMIDHFEQRTNYHISLVQKYLQRIIDLNDSRLNLTILEQEKLHDESKFQDPEYNSYIYIDHSYHLANNGGKYDPPQDIKDQMREASLHHITTNKHHPEYWDVLLSKDKIVDATMMPLDYVASMVADWLAMDEELGHDPYEWVEKNVGKKWKFTDVQIQLINDLVLSVWIDVVTKGGVGSGIRGHRTLRELKLNNDQWNEMRRLWETYKVRGATIHETLGPNFRLIFTSPANRPYVADKDEKLLLDHLQSIKDATRAVYDFSKLTKEDVKFPPSSEDPAPGKDYYYHATPVRNLTSISQNDLLQPKESQNLISVAPHLDSVHYWGSNVAGKQDDAMALLRVKRKDVRVEKHEEEDDYDPHDETAEDAVRGKISADNLEIYVKGKWHGLLPISKKSLGLSTIFKGGPGSGNWEGPGDPRYAHEGQGEFVSVAGEPLKLYMGTESSIPDEIGQGKKEFWFTSNQDVAKNYGSKVDIGYIKLSNPKEIKDVVHDDELNDWVHVAHISGNDGLVAWRVRDNGIEHTTVVSFNPKQIHKDLLKKLFNDIETKTSLGLSTILKGGPGSGNWEGPGDPRFAHEGSTEEISKETYEWLSIWVWGEEGGNSEKIPDAPSNLVMTQLKNYVPKESVYLYRAEIINAPKNQEMKSWSYNKDFVESAVELSTELGSKRKLIKRRFWPDEILIDTTKLPKSYQNKYTIAEEVIVVYGKTLKRMREVRQSMTVKFIEIKASPNSLPDRFDFSGWSFNKEAWNKRLQNEGGGFIKEMYDQQGTAAYNGLQYYVNDLAGAFNIDDPLVQEFLDDYTFKFAQGINDTTEDLLRGAMKTGMSSGLGMDGIAKLISDVYDGFKGYRSMLIARTETIRASNAAAVMAYQQSGVVEGKEWLVTKDDRLCPICRAIGAKSKKLNENFFDLGDKLTVGEGDNKITMKFDYEDVGSPPAHPNCRCTILPLILDSYKIPKSFGLSAIFKHRNHPAMGPKGGAGHISALPDKEQSIYLSQVANIGLGKAKSMVSAIRGYTNGDFYNIRIKKNDFFVKKAELLEEFIDKSPKFNGDILYRGSHVPKNLAVFTKMKVGSVIGMRGISSWSSEQKIAKQFSSSTPGDKNYFFEMVGGTNKGASVSFVHDSEQEVLVSGKSKFKIESIEEVGKHKWDQLTVVKIHEIGGAYTKSIDDIEGDVELEEKTYQYSSLQARWSLDSDLLELFHLDETKSFVDIEIKHRNHAAMGPKRGNNYLIYNQELKQTINQMIRKTKESGNEMGILLSNDGKLLGSIEGEGSSVDILFHVDINKEGSNLQSIHTHLKEEPLSYKDIEILSEYEGIKVQTAITPSGVVYIAEKTSLRKELYNRVNDLYLKLKSDAIDQFITKDKFDDFLIQGTIKLLQTLDKEGFIKYHVGKWEFVKSLGLSAIFKGGPGSGNWEGPGDPRYVHESGKQQTSSLFEKTKQQLTDIEKKQQIIEKDVFKKKLDVKDFLIGGKYQQITQERYGYDNLEHMAKDEVNLLDMLGSLLKQQNALMKDASSPLLSKINKFDSQNALYEKLKDNKDFDDLVNHIVGQAEEVYPTQKVIRLLVDQWAGTSGDTDPKAVAMQIAASELFGDGKIDHLMKYFEKGDISPMAKEVLNSELKFNPGRKAFLQAQYDATQKYFKDNDIKELILYRGQEGKRSKLDGGDSVEVDMQPLSSFSTSSEIAYSFAGAIYYTGVKTHPSIIMSVIPVSRVFAIPNTGIGCTGEKEVVVLGGKMKATVVTDIPNIENAFGIISESKLVHSVNDIVWNITAENKRRLSNKTLTAPILSGKSFTKSKIRQIDKDKFEESFRESTSKLEKKFKKIMDDFFDEQKRSIVVDIKKDFSDVEIKHRNHPAMGPKGGDRDVEDSVSFEMMMKLNKLEHISDQQRSSQSYENVIGSFNNLVDKWTREVDPQGKIDAYSLAVENHKLRRGLLKEQYGDWKGSINVYRVGPITDQITSVFPNRIVAESYAARFGVDSVYKFAVNKDDLVPAMTGAGELFVNREHLVEYDSKKHLGLSATLKHRNHPAMGPHPSSINNNNLEKEERDNIYEITKNRLDKQEFACFTVDGKKVEVAGMDSAVMFTEEQMNQMEYMVHNHPGGASFSGQDVSMLLQSPKLRKIEVVTSDGTVYSLEKLAKDMKPNLNIPVLNNLMASSALYDWNSIMESIRPEFQKRWKAGEDSKELWKNHTHLVMEKLALEKNLLYKRTLNVYKWVSGILVKNKSEDLKKGGFILDDSSIVEPPYGKKKSLDLSTIFKGGPGSGNYGHEGRPGEVGGSGGGSFGDGVLNLTPEQLSNSKHVNEVMDKDIFKRQQIPDEKGEVNLPDIANKIFVQQEITDKLFDHPAFKVPMSGVAGRYEEERIIKEFVKENIAQWASSSGDTSAASIALQLTAKEHFKFEDVNVEHLGKLNKLEVTVANYRLDSNYPVGGDGTYKLKDVQSAFLQAQYDATQKYFKDAGIKEVILYRGVEHFDGGKLRTEEVSLQPMSSFSMSVNTAIDFTYNKSEQTLRGTLYASVVPVEKILSHPRTGFGCTNEKEVVVLGGKIKATVGPTKIIKEIYETAYEVPGNAHFNDKFLTSLNKVTPEFRKTFGLDAIFKHRNHPAMGPHPNSSSIMNELENTESSKDKSFEDLPKWQQTAWINQSSKLSDNERNVVSEYQSSGIYDPMNIYLRTGKLKSSFSNDLQDDLFAGGLTEESLPWLKQEIDDLDKSISLSLAPSECTVFRGVDNDVMKNVKIGDVYIDKGFMSTSFNLSVSRDFAGEQGSLLKIRIKHGTKALYADPISDLDQKEVILARNSKLKVTAIRKEDNRRVLYADLIKE